MTTVQSETATEVGELVERLREGPVRTGDTENGEYELFDIKEATATMLVAAWAVTALQSQAAKLKVAEEALRAIAAFPNAPSTYGKTLGFAREALATIGSTDANF
jgi:hypothetical protein